MTRTERLLRLARLRGDKAAEAILDTAINVEIARAEYARIKAAIDARKWTEAELRAAWGDR